jgi:hypothetical protein
MDMGELKVFICYYDHAIIDGKTTCKWLLTTDENYARETGQSYTLASIKDLHDWQAAVGQVFTGILTTADGLCKWYEETWLDELGMEEYFCAYIPLD